MVISNSIIIIKLLYGIIKFMNTQQIIIAPQALRKDIFRHLTTDNEVVLGWQVLSLETFKSTLLNDLTDPNFEFTSAYLTVLNRITPRNRYYQEIRYPSFFRYFYDFANKLAEYGISADQLPQAEEVDKKEILSTILSCPLNSLRIHEAFYAIKDASNIHIYDYYHDSLSEDNDLKYLIAKGAKLIKLPRYEIKQESFFGVNPVKEVMAIAQYLVQNKKTLKPEDTVLMVNEPENYLPVISHIFDLYRIPYKLNQDNINNTIMKFRYYLRFAWKKDISSFLDAYNSGCFGNTVLELNDYIAHFKLNFEQLMEPFHIVKDWDNYTFALANQDDYLKLLQCEQLAEEKMKEIREIIKEIPSSLKDITSFIFEQLQTEDRDSLQTIFDICINTVPLLDEEDNSYLLLDHLLGRVVSRETVDYSDGILVSPVYESCLDRSTAIIIGCQQTAFPKSISEAGFFDEYYLEKIKGYPLLTRRTDFFNEQFEKHLHTFKHIIFSMPSSDSEGKAAVFSNFVTRRCEPENWPLIENNILNRREATISSENARKLYVEHQRLYASPSGFESYIGCPFRFFLQRGIKLQQEELFTIGANTIGTLQHAIMEEFYQNEHPFDMPVIMNRLDEYIDNLKQLFPNDINLIESMNNRLKMNITTKLEFLQTTSNSGYHAVGYEKHVHHIIDQKDYSIYMHGSIDRVDESDDSFMIVDYKSSDKSISEETVKRGKMIQLLTYLLMFARSSDKIPAAMSYFSLKNDTKEFNEKDKDEAETSLKANRYSTYCCGNTELDTEIFNVKRFHPDTKTYLPIIETIYRTVAERIVSGNIAIDPHNDACTFCPYRQICHNMKDPSEKSELFVPLEKDDENGQTE